MRTAIIYSIIFFLIFIFPGLVAYKLGIILGGATALSGFFALFFFLNFWGRRIPGLYIPGTGILALFSFLTILFFGLLGNETALLFFGGMRSFIQTSATEVAGGVQSLAHHIREANHVWWAKKGVGYYEEDGKLNQLEQDTKLFLLQEEKGETQRFGWFLLPNKLGHFDEKNGSKKVRFAFSDLEKKIPKETTLLKESKKEKSQSIKIGPASSAIRLPVEIFPNTKVLEGEGSLVISWQKASGFVINCPDAKITIQRFGDKSWIKRGTTLGAFPWNIIGSSQGILEIQALRVEFIGPAQKGFYREISIEPLGGGKLKLEEELEFHQVSF